MAYDLEEQEQLAALKAWWQQYRHWMMGLLILALTAYSAYTGWRYYAEQRALRAAHLYAELQKAVSAKDQTKVGRIATDIQAKFAQTVYAPLSALIAATNAYHANDTKTARAQLNWIVERKSNDEFNALAKIRLAGIALDEKAYDDGLKWLAGDFPAAFAALVADRKGDIFTAQNKRVDARAAYEDALRKTGQRDPARQLIQLKLDSVGG